MPDMFKEVALAGGVQKAGSETHTHIHICRCTHIPDASRDSVTSCSGAGFDGMSVCQAGAEINLRVKENEGDEAGRLKH